MTNETAAVGFTKIAPENVDDRESGLAELRRLAELRGALTAQELLSSLATLGVTTADISEVAAVDERTVRRWNAGDAAPTPKKWEALGDLRVVLMHILQRGGLPVDRVSPWLRLPDTALDFDSPLQALRGRRLRDVVAAYDAYVLPPTSPVQAPAHVGGSKHDTPGDD
ncbi:MAG: hypothetical protein J7513_02560 [Solirubrobacteraceae bacterium]|nr:hypothetical protein [Solirubrobacteraceae bacterium]